MSRWRCVYGSERLPSKAQRRKAKSALRRGTEPEPQYRTGRFWSD